MTASESAEPVLRFPARFRCVGVFAPAGSPEREALARGIRRLRRSGMRVVWQPPGTVPDRYLAGPDHDRAAAINTLLADDRVHLLMAARGGYGCTRLLERVDWALWRHRSLPLVGYSDVSALHLAGLRHGIGAGVSGPLAAVELGRETPTPAAISAWLAAAAWFQHAWKAVARSRCVTGIRLQSVRPGRCQGPLVPANLTVLTTLLGTDYLPDLRGAILVLEDVNEPSYRIDRCLTQLRQAGVLASLAGCLFGAFAGTEDPEWLPDVLADAAASVPGPVAKGVPFGHCFPSLSLPVGRPAQLAAADADATLGWDGPGPG